MIRDPSDGSVREKPAAKAKTAVPDSGLREASPKDTYQARLNWSRDWMKAYHAKKELGHAGADIEQKLPQAGHSIGDNA